MDANNKMGCAGGCQGCGQPCAADGEKKVNFFDKVEEISMKLNEIGEETLLNILNEAIAKWEQEEEEGHDQGEAQEDKE